MMKISHTGYLSVFDVFHHFFLVWNFLSVFGTECQIMIKNAIPFNIPNNDRIFQSQIPENAK